MPLWTMASKPDQIAPCTPSTPLMTLEDHLRDGGFGSWLIEAMALRWRHGTCVVRPVALTPEVCGTVGSQATLNRLGGLMP